MKKELNVESTEEKSSNGQKSRFCCFFFVVVVFNIYILLMLSRGDTFILAASSQAVVQIEKTFSFFYENEKRTKPFNIYGQGTTKEYVWCMMQLQLPAIEISFVALMVFFLPIFIFRFDNIHLKCIGIISIGIITIAIQC